MQTVAMILIGAVVSGIIFAVAWVAFWSVIAPQLSPELVWPGHDAHIIKVFWVGFLAGPVTGILLVRS